MMTAVCIVSSLAASVGGLSASMSGHAERSPMYLIAAALWMLAGAQFRKE